MMLTSLPLEPVDYLVIGHVSQDVIPGGFRLGGTVSFSALTAKALGLRVGVVTSCRDDLAIPELAGIQVFRLPADQNTTFQNIQTTNGRIQTLLHRADTLEPYHIPEAWRKTPLIHIGPVAQEISPQITRGVESEFIGVTPQGWLRQWDSDGHVGYSDWLEAPYFLPQVNAAVISIEDVNFREEVIEDFLTYIRILVVTEGPGGARIYWNGDLRRFRSPIVAEIDPTGAGDIFATAFFHRLTTTKDPWEAARFATGLASLSVTRPGLAGVPTAEEIQSISIEVIS